jgi:hypothetical protein
MKNRSVEILFALLFVFTSIAFGAPTSFEVQVSDAAGKVAYKGTTNGDGTFATGKLPPGNYVVQFSSQSVKGDRTIVVSAGKKKVRAESVAASQIRNGGVAMKIEVGSGLNITGQVAAMANGLNGPASPRAHDRSVEAMGNIQERGGEGTMVIPGHN